MQIQEIPRTLVRAGLQAQRLPLTAAESVLLRGKDEATVEEWPPALAFGLYQAGVKQVVGSVLRDEELLEEGRLERAKVNQLRKAAELDTLAEQRKGEADAEFRARKKADEQRRKQVEQQAKAREQAIEREKADEARKLKAEAARKEEAAAKIDAVTRKAVEKQERAARSTRVTAERSALQEERRAVAAQGTVTEIDRELAETKAIRKAR